MVKTLATLSAKPFKILQSIKRYEVTLKIWNKTTPLSTRLKINLLFKSVWNILLTVIILTVRYVLRRGLSPAYLKRDHS